MFSKGEYLKGVEHKKEADKVIYNKELRNFINEFIEYILNNCDTGITYKGRVSDISIRADSISITVDEGEYGTAFVDMPIDYLWMNTWDWQELEREKYEEKARLKDLEDKKNTEQNERKLLERLKSKYENG